MFTSCVTEVVVFRLEWSGRSKTRHVGRNNVHWNKCIFLKYTSNFDALQYRQNITILFRVNCYVNRPNSVHCVLYTIQALLFIILESISRTGLVRSISSTESIFYTILYNLRYHINFRKYYFDYVKRNRNNDISKYGNDQIKRSNKHIHNRYLHFLETFTFSRCPYKTNKKKKSSRYDRVLITFVLIHKFRTYNICYVHFS